VSEEGEGRADDDGDLDTGVSESVELSLGGGECDDGLPCAGREEDSAEEGDEHAGCSRLGPSLVGPASVDVDAMDWVLGVVEDDSDVWSSSEVVQAALDRRDALVPWGVGFLGQDSGDVSEVGASHHEPDEAAEGLAEGEGGVGCG
jgi:hypothetical protein